MKTSMYFNYTSRSLVRGGQRTVLAIFCVAVGVMAIVALQLVGLMINNAFNTNVRDANGGDIAVTSQNQPFNNADLQHFATFKRDGTITAYTPIINASGKTGTSSSSRNSFSIKAVDPATYPIVTPLSFVNPKNAAVSSLLKNNQAIVTQSFADQYKDKLGSTLDVHIGSDTQGGRTLHVKIVGIASETGILNQAGSLLLVSIHDYNAAAPKVAPLYDTVDVDADSSKINAAVTAIQNQFPIASTQTASDALKQQQTTIDNIRKFLEIAGLLALLIGGVGIVNTMQVLLSRRKTEIAMLKTTGYRRFDLYLLFGLEAGLLGFIGGMVGALAAVGVSYVVRNLVQQTFGLNIPYVLSWYTIIGGVVVGLITALIFGLLPIVQAANIRPLNVIRDLPDGRGAGSVVLTIVLLIVLSILFCALSIVILNGDITLGIFAVYGTFIFLGILSLVLGLIIFILSKLPVLERFNIWYLLVVTLLVVLSVALYLVLPAFGILLLVASLLGYIVVLLPLSWKETIKMALRNLGRQRGRTTTTMLALFVGIFTIGLILALGQNLRQQINSVIANSLDYNVFTITSNNDTTKLHNNLSAIPGLTAYQQRTLASTVPVAINNVPIGKLLPTGKGQNAGSGTLGRQGAIYYLSGVEGYDVGNNQIPSTQSATFVGRNLTLNDAGTNNVVVSSLLSTLGPFHLKLGDKITLTGIDRSSLRTVTVVGFYKSSTVGSNIYPIWGTTDTVKALSPAGVNQSIFYMKIDSNKLGTAVNDIGNLVPNAFVINLGNISSFIDQLINDILLTLTTIASLSLIAGVIIIANAVALSMLERRRELGILKSVGYTSRSVLSEVLLENGLVGGIGALVAMLIVTAATSALGVFLFKSTFGVDAMTALSLILGAAALAMLVAALVAWGAVRVRPLEVLRYE